MNRRLRRSIALSLFVISIGCGSNSSRSNDQLEQDAGPEDLASDAGQPTSGKSTDVKENNSEAMPTQTGTADAGSDTGSTEPASCDELKCKAPAKCKQKDGEAPRCSCPDGYDDPKGDGSECKDKNECDKSEDNDCDAHAHCKNTPGGYECKCDGPAYDGDGKHCSCADGYKQQDGLCLADDGEQCGDNLDCVNGHCVSGICCAQACADPGAECRTTDGATCEDGHTCKYPKAADGAQCDDADACTQGSTCQDGKCLKGTEPTNCDDGNPCTDDSCDVTDGCKNVSNTAACDDGNPCTQDDACSGGACSGSSDKDCSTQDDACNLGACNPDDGSCYKKPRENGTQCDDANSCSTKSACSAGMCAGASDACGPNATACMPGTPNTCTCAPNYHEKDARCVPDNDECDQNPCSPNADCFDTSNDPNTATCTCKPGYSGDGKTCYLTEPCKDNPCGEGRGTCTAGELGAYTCACDAGFIAVGGTCVCDLSGTFALRSELDLSWPDSSGIEGGSATSTTWALEHHEYDASGKLTIEQVGCGETNLDLCGTGVGALIPVEAYAQYLPGKTWSDPNPVPAVIELELPDALPGAPFETPMLSVLQGVSLDKADGAWPASRTDVQGTNAYDGTAVNNARWVDADGDGSPGITTYAVGPGGVAADGTATAPLEAYGATSPVCPRKNPNAKRSSYNYPPAAEGLTVRRVKRFFSANRVTSKYVGELASCDRISGSIAGPDNGAVAFDTRIGGCVRVNGNSESACSSTVVDFLDSNNESEQTVDSSRFVIQRVPDETTCEQVRNLDFEASSN